MQLTFQEYFGVVNAKKKKKEKEKKKKDFLPLKKLKLLKENF